MQTDPETDKEEFEEDLKTFEESPAEDKDLQRLKIDQEKSTGEERLEINEEIEEKTD